MEGSVNATGKVLILPAPRWPYLWPLLLIPIYGLNGALNLGRSWHGSLWEKGLGLVLMMGWLLVGCSMVVGIIATTWRELRIDDGRLYLESRARAIPRWMRWLWNPQASRAFREGQLEIDLAQASLEWVGKTLLLHGHPDTDVRLGRGGRAELIATWLMNQGLSSPVGR